MAADLWGVVTQPPLVALLVAAGLLLLTVEVSVLPGFGVGGVLGLAALGAGVALALAGAGSAAAAVERAAVALGTALLFAAGGAALVLRLVPAARLGRGLVLKDCVVGAPGAPGARRGAPAGGRRGPLQGARGVAVTDLRPVGRVRLEGPAGAPGGPPVDVVTGGEYVAAGEAVEVVADEGYRHVVRRVAAHRPRLHRGSGSGRAPGGSR
jgi:membrane-bound serine protease (ClpP class)